MRFLLSVPTSSARCHAPGYGEIRLAIAPRMGVRKSLAQNTPDIVHIATEGPIGWSTRRWCMAHGVPFTTAFHTRFPDYASVRTGLSPDFFWPMMRRFHAPSRAVLAATPRLMDELAGRGIAHTRLWTRGIDTEIFRTGLAPYPALCGFSAPNPALGGQDRGRKKSGKLSGCQSRRHQGHCWRRSGQSRISAKISRCCVHWLAIGQRTGAGLCCRRRFRFSQQNRYIRAGDDRGTRLWRAGGGLSCSRAAGHHRTEWKGCIRSAG